MTYIIDQPAPKTLQEALRMAAKDLERVSKDPRYVVDMAIWHQPFNGTCIICFAGAVMSGFFDHDEIGGFNEFDSSWWPVFSALDSFRSGDRGLALADMGQHHLIAWFDRGQKRYTGKLTADEIQDLIKHARDFADELDRRQAVLDA